MGHAERIVLNAGRQRRSPVIVVTGHSDALAGECVALVAVDVMIKPIDVDDFVIRWLELFAE